MIETLIMSIVKEKIPVNASFFLTSIEAFQRKFVDIRITGVMSDLAIETATRRRPMTY